jgi:hypothetical protein
MPAMTPCIGQWSAFEARQDQIASRPDAVVQHPEDVGLEFFDLIALKHRAARSDHARFELVNRKRLRLSGQPGNQA